MLALTVEPAQIVVGILVGAVAFLLAWFLLGSAARQKQDRERAQRMRAVIQPGQQQGGAAPPTPSRAGGSPTTSPSSGRASPSLVGSANASTPSSRPPGCRCVRVSSWWRPPSRRWCSACSARRSCAARFWRWSLPPSEGAFPTLLLRSALKKRAEKLREQLPDVLTIMASSLRAGHSFLQSLDTVAKEIAHPAAAEFQRVVAEVRLGRPVEDALESLAERVGSPDFMWAVLAVNIQREVGGNLAEILDTVADTLRERAMLRRQIKVLTAEGRLSAWVLGSAAVRDRAVHVRGEPGLHRAALEIDVRHHHVDRGRSPAGGGDPLDEEDRGYRCLTSGWFCRSRLSSWPSCWSGCTSIRRGLRSNARCVCSRPRSSVRAGSRPPNPTCARSR